MKVKWIESHLLFNSMCVLYLSKVVVSQHLFENATWFEGTFGFIMPKSGCPDGYFWENGTRSQLLNFFGNSVACKKQNACHFYKNEEWCYPVVDTYYCVKVHPESLNPWPNGSYCVNMFGVCPRGFTNGSILWDDHNIGSDENRVAGRLPSGTFDANTMFEYCCRSDGDASKPVSFPTSKPFYLYRYKGECQRIANMVVVEETVKFITSRRFLPDNDDEQRGTVPDSSLNPIVIHFCYYENETQPERAGVMRTCKGLNVPGGTGCSKCCLGRHLAWMFLVYMLTLTSCF